MTGAIEEGEKASRRSAADRRRYAVSAVLGGGVGAGGSRISTQGVFLTLLLAGILFLVGSLLITRLHWRRDMAPYGRWTSHLDVILNPGRYTEEAPLRAIRALSSAGAILLAGAVAVLIYELIRTIWRAHELP